MIATNAELESLRKVLTAKRARLLGMVERNVAEGTHSEEATFPDAMDAATRTEEENELLGLADHERRLLSEIDHALAKFDSGTYGLSELSQRPIPIERLRAVPWARLTAEEEERRVAHSAR